MIQSQRKILKGAYFKARLRDLCVKFSDDICFPFGFRHRLWRQATLAATKACYFITYPSSLTMSLWVDKHRPKKLSKLDFHESQAAHLSRLVSSGDFPHLLISGPSGSGKRTRMVALLRELYGAGVERLRIEHQNFTTPSNRKVEIITIASNYHIEVISKEHSQVSINICLMGRFPRLGVCHLGLS